MEILVKGIASRSEPDSAPILAKWVRRRTFPSFSRAGERQIGSDLKGGFMRRCRKETVSAVAAGLRHTTGYNGLRDVNIPRHR